MYYRAFKEVKIEDGQQTEFLREDEFVGQIKPFKSFIIPEHNQDAEEVVTKRDYIYVPTYTLGGFGDSSDKSAKAVRRKLNIDCKKLLITAGLEHAIIKAASRERLKFKAKGLFFKNIKMIKFAKNAYIIINMDSNSCVMPIRNDIQTFEDPLSNGYYSTAEIGLAVLNNEAIILGEIT